VLFVVPSARAGRGDQAEGDGLANTAVLLRQENPRPRQDGRLFTCIHFSDQTAFWEVRSEPFGSRLSQNGSSKRKAPAL
jgi:hypothetical protein